MYDLIIRGGSIVDGTGRPAFKGDIAVTGDRIAAVGEVDGTARREIDAAGLIVTPGWVDIHTHYDGQATWDPQMAPSSWHGVTTAIMGNCGVGFAPVRPDDHQFLIELMEGVEDIPWSCRWPRASTGNGRASRNTSTRSRRCRAPSTSACTCRMRR